MAQKERTPGDKILVDFLKQEGLTIDDLATPEETVDMEEYENDEA